jgi:hypothetical protein
MRPKSLTEKKHSSTFENSELFPEDELQMEHFIGNNLRKCVGNGEELVIQ